MATRLKTLQYALAVCVLVAAPASANPVYKESISQSPAKIASAKNEHFVSKPRSIAGTIEDMIAAPDWQPGYTMVLTSAVNSMRLTLSMESAVKKISLLDAHSGSVEANGALTTPRPPRVSTRSPTPSCSVWGSRMIRLQTKPSNTKANNCKEPARDKRSV